MRAGFVSARAAAKRFGWPPSTYGAHENGSRGIPIEEAEKYGRAFKASHLWILHGGDRGQRIGVPIVGLAGAGPDGSILYSDGDGELGEAPMPPGGSERTVAVEVRGESMRGIAEDGWLVYYDDRRDPPTTDLIGELCVVGLSDGRVLVKKLFQGRRKRHFDLESVAAPMLRDVRVDWAAMVTAIIPRRQARKLAAA